MKVQKLQKHFHQRLWVQGMKMIAMMTSFDLIQIIISDFIKLLQSQRRDHTTVSQAEK